MRRLTAGPVADTLRPHHPPYTRHQTPPQTHPYLRLRFHLAQSIGTPTHCAPMSAPSRRAFIVDAHATRFLRHRRRTQRRIQRHTQLPTTCRRDAVTTTFHNATGHDAAANSRVGGSYPAAVSAADPTHQTSSTNVHDTTLTPSRRSVNADACAMRFQRRRLSDALSMSIPTRRAFYVDAYATRFLHSFALFIGKVAVASAARNSRAGGSNPAAALAPM